MNAESLLHKIARVFAEHHLEAVMVGNAAAALHGAPVTTLDIDFMFRKTPANLKILLTEQGVFNEPEGAYPRPSCAYLLAIEY